MSLSTTTYGVYIIESLKYEDYFDGENLDAILNAAKIISVHHHAFSKEDLKDKLKDFRRSKFRYLYISCHGNQFGFSINGERILNSEFQTMLGNVPKTRIFMSSCKGANKLIADLMIGKSKVISLIGFPINIDQDKAGVFWPAFFYIMKEIDEEKMVRNDISSTLKKLSDLFKVPINYYSSIKDDDEHLRRLKIRNGKATDNRKLQIRF